jgi:hypothetical protein
VPGQRPSWKSSPSTRTVRNRGLSGVRFLSALVNAEDVGGEVERLVLIADKHARVEDLPALSFLQWSWSLVRDTRRGAGVTTSTSSEVILDEPSDLVGAIARQRVGTAREHVQLAVW